MPDPPNPRSSRTANDAGRGGKHRSLPARVHGSPISGFFSRGLRRAAHRVFRLRHTPNGLFDAPAPRELRSRARTPKTFFFIAWPAVGERSANRDAICLYAFLMRCEAQGNKYPSG